MIDVSLLNSQPAHKLKKKKSLTPWSLKYVSDFWSADLWDQDWESYRSSPLHVPKIYCLDATEVAPPGSGYRNFVYLWEERNLQRNKISLQVPIPNSHASSVKSKLSSSITTSFLQIYIYNWSWRIQAFWFVNNLVNYFNHIWGTNGAVKDLKE